MLLHLNLSIFGKIFFASVGQNLYRYSKSVICDNQPDLTYDSYVLQNLNYCVQNGRCFGIASMSLELMRLCFIKLRTL